MEIVQKLLIKCFLAILTFFSPREEAAFRCVEGTSLSLLRPYATSTAHFHEIYKDYQTKHSGDAYGKQKHLKNCF